jgi:hypothetical protein
MSGKRAEPSASGAPGEGDSGAGRQPEQRGERVGPVVVERHVKDDGRALILYTRVEPGRA